MTKQTKAAVLEGDADKRAEIYEELQREHQKSSPFVLMFQQTEVAGPKKSKASDGPELRQQLLRGDKSSGRPMSADR